MWSHVNKKKLTNLLVNQTERNKKLLLCVPTLLLAAVVMHLERKANVKFHLVSILTKMIGFIDDKLNFLVVICKIYAKEII